MPAPLTEATEIGTALGMLGHDSLMSALAEHPAQLADVSEHKWAELTRSATETSLWADWDAAWRNGAAFLEARDGLRGRRPLLMEWRGALRPSADAVIPVDLRVDHVYLISCKYLSKILFNGSPSGVFEGLLGLRPASRSADWYSTVASREHQALYELVRLSDGPSHVDELSKDERRAVRVSIGSAWTAEAATAYAELVRAVSAETARRWRVAMEGIPREAVLMRLLRMYDAPYFVLGASRQGPMRLRVGTPWDWRRRYKLRDLEITASQGGQPGVIWMASVADGLTGEPVLVNGHVEVRWSHGRFGGPPEAKVYLDTPHAAVPGYFALA